MQVEELLKYKRIAICGYRKYGRELYMMLKELQIEVPYIIERNYEALRITENMDIPIVGFKEEGIYAQAEAVIITPDLDNCLIEECLELAGIQIPTLKMSDLIME